MKLMVLAPAVLPTLAEVDHKMRFFLKSCVRWGVFPHLYGIGTTRFPGYQAMKIDVPLAWMEANKQDYTHVLYTDSWDAVITGPLEEMKEKYEGLGKPPFLIAAWYQFANVSDEAKQYPGVWPNIGYYHYPQVGGYVAEIPLMIDTFRRMKKEYSKYNDDTFAWSDAKRDGWWHPTLDSQCEIFQVRSEEHIEVAAGHRIWNKATGTYPCIWHICGGYTSHETGTDERMTPIAEMLGLL